MGGVAIAGHVRCNLRRLIKEKGNYSGGEPLRRFGSRFQGGSVFARQESLHWRDYSQGWL